jgi:hypothetical protein
MLASVVAIEADLRRTIDALQAIIAFADDHASAWSRLTAVDWILALTTMRSVSTAKAVSTLLLSQLVEPAQMLCRSLFEDMVVVHWLLMQDDPGFLVERFFDHADVSALRDYDYFTREMGLPYGDRPGVADALRRRDQLGSAGTRRDQYWWGARRDGDGVVPGLGMASIVKELQTHQPYAPRFHGGDEPALKNAYALATRWTNERLHHTARGLPALLARDGRIYWVDFSRQATTAAVMAYWTLGQTLYLQLTYGTVDNDVGPATEFDGQFIARTTDIAGMTGDEVRRALADARANLPAPDA